MDSTLNEEVLDAGSSGDRIAVLEVNGVIQDTGGAGSLFESAGYNHQSFLEQLDAVEKDDTVKGVILKVNSPGGGVVESAQIHKKLEEIKKDTKKPIYVSMGGTAASGGYYISAPRRSAAKRPLQNGLQSTGKWTLKARSCSRGLWTAICTVKFPPKEETARNLRPN